MALVYLDTSALAKWYLPEKNSEEFVEWLADPGRSLYQQPGHYGVSLPARQKATDEAPRCVQVQELYARFQQDIQDGHLLHYPVTDRHILNAELLIEGLPTVALRTLDAQHRQGYRGGGAGNCGCSHGRGCQHARFAGCPF